MANTENMLIEDMMQARMADTGMPDNTRYDPIMAARTTTDTCLRTFKARNAAANSAVTMTRWAPETATRWAKPAALKQS